LERKNPPGETPPLYVEEQVPTTNVTKREIAQRILNKLLTGDFGRVGKIISELKTCKDIIKRYKYSGSIVNYTVIYNAVISISSILDSTILFKNFQFIPL
jgi:hypothetical protein